MQTGCPNRRMDELSWWQVKAMDKSSNNQVVSRVIDHYNLKCKFSCPNCFKSQAETKWKEMG